MEKKLLTEQDVAEILGVSVRTLQYWRYHGSELKFVRLSAKAVRYRLADVEEFINNRIVNSTSQEIHN